MSDITVGLAQGRAAAFLVRPSNDPATGTPHLLDEHNVLVDRVTGDIIGRRDAKAPSRAASWA